jgi:signal transduction histidine kinase
MRLAEFIRHNRQSIIDEWESFAKTLAPAENMTQMQLRDHIEPILTFIARDIESTQSPTQQISKSHGERDNPEARKDSAAETHGNLRHDDGFDIVQMVSEYRALRGSIVKLWTKAKGGLDNVDLVDLTRFNEAVDQALAESVVKFMKKVDYSKDLLLGVLGHDIRTPIGAMMMSGMLLPRVGSLNEKQTALASQIGESAIRVNKIVGDLLDLARARMGTSLPVVKRPMDIGRVARQVVDEIQVLHPNRTVSLDTNGDLRGEWDETRMGQLFSNLVGNAVQYGKDGSPINVMVQGSVHEISISVRNECEPIPTTQLTTIFNSFTRGDRQSDADTGSNLGLGLFITKEIVTAHGGSIDIASNAEGTTFIVRIPR